MTDIEWRPLTHGSEISPPLARTFDALIATLLFDPSRRVVVLPGEVGTLRSCTAIARHADGFIACSMLWAHDVDVPEVVMFAGTAPRVLGLLPHLTFDELEWLASLIEHTYPHEARMVDPMANSMLTAVREAQASIR